MVAARKVGLALALAGAVVCEEEASGHAVEKGAEEDVTAPYVRPDSDAAGMHWAETFDGDVWSRWTAATSEKYNGKLAVAARQQEALVGDLGLHVPDEARHYGASAKFPALVSKEDSRLVVQYEVRFQEGLTCGGSYLKFFDSKAAPEGFKDDTPYVIMFGPDRCGGTDKVHFILRHQNPKTGKWEEKHCEGPPSVPQDTKTHLYRLEIRPDETFDIAIDGEKKFSGSLHTSMTPPINPPKEIDDPTDSKPGDWIDEPKMDDPEASKPDDWDEDAPHTIPDPKETKPEGWNDDAPKMIADPQANKPEDWDDEEDGEWEAPQIANPDCSVGCGPWQATRISNPAYKGKWHAPKVDNPEYKGVWKARQVPNPEYFVDASPHVLPTFDSVGIDIWTMSKSILFDNIVIATSPKAADDFANASFRLRKDIEEKQQPKPPPATFTETALEFAQNNMVAVITTSIVVALTSLWCLCSGSGAPRAPTPEERKEARQRKRAEAERKANDAAEDENDAKSNEDVSKGDAKESIAQGGDEDGSKKQEGGLGDLSTEDDS